MCHTFTQIHIYTYTHTLPLYMCVCMCISFFLNPGLYQFIDFRAFCFTFAFCMVWSDVVGRWGHLSLWLEGVRSKGWALWLFNKTGWQMYEFRCQRESTGNTQREDSKACIWTLSHGIKGTASYISVAQRRDPILECSDRATFAELNAEYKGSP